MRSHLDKQENRHQTSVLTSSSNFSPTSPEILHSELSQGLFGGMSSHLQHSQFPVSKGFLLKRRTVVYTRKGEKTDTACYKTIKIINHGGI